LGASLLIFLGGALLSGPIEPFAATNLNKDKVRKERQLWFEEEIMSEDPHGIQDRTENPNLSYDEVTEGESSPWHGERVLNEHPEAIQDKAVNRVPEYDEGGSSYGHH